MVKIGYSVYMAPNPQNSEAAPKAYAALQLNGTVSISDLARHMAEHNSKYNRGDIIAVMTNAVDCMREMLAQGNKVSLGDLGDFSPSISSNPAEKLEDFTSANIKGLNINFKPGPYLRNLRDVAEFVPVASRAAQAATLKAEKLGQSTVDLGAAKTSISGGSQG